jgi:murein DD-endopeptidase MepM/ murein hydrolase activator NlpD
LKKPIPVIDHFGKRKRVWLGIAVIFVVLLVVGYILLRQYTRVGIHFMRLQQFWDDPEKYAHWGLSAGDRCGNAPFLIPTDGFVAFFWGDHYRSGAKHQGVDIFSPEGPQGIGLTPVVAVYDGYLTRLPNWRSAVILRIPKDPLQSDRQIWIYYAHMADADGKSFIVSDFPPGSSEVLIEAGTLIGYQGNYSGDPVNPTSVHLHFSIVLDDGKGQFRNELEFRNSLDPSPYLGVELNGERIGNQIATCTQE